MTDGIRAYSSEVTDRDGISHKVIAMDTEGTGGSDATFSLPGVEAATATASSLGARLAAFAGGGGDKPPSTPATANSTVSKRRKCVETAYPRLLYSFADILIIVTMEPPRARVGLVRNLLAKIKVASSSIANQLFKPSLIVVHNKIALTDGHEHWEIHQFLRDWRLDKDVKQGGRLNNDIVELETYFHDVAPICIPEWTADKVLCMSQIQTLKDLVADRLAAAAKRKSRGNQSVARQALLGPDGSMLYTHKQLLTTLRKAVSLLDNDVDAPLDTAALLLDSLPPPSGLSEFLLEHFKLVQETLSHDPSKHATPAEWFDAALQLTRVRFVDAVLLSLLGGLDSLDDGAEYVAGVEAMRSLCASGELSSDFKQVWATVENMMSNYEPCGTPPHVFKNVLVPNNVEASTVTNLIPEVGVRCFELRGFHSDTHRAPFTYCSDTTKLTRNIAWAAAAVVLLPITIVYGARATRVGDSTIADSPCQWNGKYTESTSRARDGGSFVRHLLSDAVLDMPNARGAAKAWYMDARVKKLSKQYKSLSLVSAMKGLKTACTNCMQHPAKYNYPCGHRICALCTHSDWSSHGCPVCGASV
jgi:hypothetical protein